MRARFDSKKTNGLFIINGLYQFVNAPAYGYGTPAPKAAELSRAYKYNLKTEDKESNIGGYNIEYCAVPKLEDFRFDEVTGNYNPRFVCNQTILKSLSPLMLIFKQFHYLKRMN